MGLLGSLTGVFDSTGAASLYCFKGSFDNYDVFPLPLSNALLLNSTCYNSTRSTVGFVGGYMSKMNGPFITALGPALISQQLNVFLVNWDKEAASGPLGPQLSYAVSAVPNAKIVGNNVGEAVTILSRAPAGMNTSRLHLIGHSLGAHLMSFAARRAIDNGYMINRVTGLDPARAGFESPFGMLLGGIGRGCARFVDIIHTDAGTGGYGITESVGDADFYPNNGGKSANQPGCPNGTFPMFSSEDLCSHDRSWQLFLESIQSPMAFPAASAPDYDAWARVPASSTNIAYMGYPVSTSASGNYFLTTGATSPYGLGVQGLTPNPSQTSG